MIRGYVRLYAVDFNDWNLAATIKANLIGLNVTSYTYYKNDVNSNYVWARVEDDGITDLPIIEESEAIIQGMVL